MQRALSNTGGPHLGALVNGELVRRVHLNGILINGTKKHGNKNEKKNKFNFAYNP